MKKQAGKFPKIVVILGPTATGKSDLAVHIAQKFGGEVVSADSRQVYKGLNIGSGKITEKEKRGIPHHLLDIADPKKIYNAEKFREDGTKAVREILKRKKLPVICGGTGFYIDALVHNERFPDAPPNKKLRKRLEKKSAENLMKTIIKLDPRRAGTLDPYNKVRIIRAIEIAKTLGKVPKVKRVKQYETLFIGLLLSRAKLRERIHARLLKRMKAGMVREISSLHRNGVSWKRLFDLGLEYRYVSLYLRNKLSRQEMLAKLEQEICQFAKRQMQWFKRNKNIKWFAPGKNARIKKELTKFIK
ncbi:MAG: tRNA (adenosine(37)-N6)-dimethylallyltransferase MiaA [Patescibacteria group bacterium]